MEGQSLRLLATEAIQTKMVNALGFELCQTLPMIRLVSINLLKIPERTWNVRRRQVFGPGLLSHLQKKLSLGEMGLWIVDQDLFAPGMNFVFGQARKGMGAVLSTARLGNAFSFIVKEAIHEMGHVLGLDHCRLPCVMTFSNSVADANLKVSRLCICCRKLLERLSPSCR